MKEKIGTQSQEKNQSFKTAVYRSLAWAFFIGLIMPFVLAALINGILFFGFVKQGATPPFQEIISLFFTPTFLGISLALSITGFITVFLFVLLERINKNIIFAFIASVVLWFLIGTYFVLNNPETLNDNPPILVILFFGIILGIGYPVILGQIMDKIEQWFGISSGVLK